METYQPQPLDTSSVTLPEELLPLMERLAENAHDVWAVQRIKDRWTFGPQRNDTKKTNPCLVPYADLPESEKEYDRKISAEALKAVIALGYEIRPV